MFRYNIITRLKYIKTFFIKYMAFMGKNYCKNNGAFHKRISKLQYIMEVRRSLDKQNTQHIFSY